MSGTSLETPAHGAAVKHEDLKLGDRYQVAFMPVGGLVQWLPARLQGFRPETENLGAQYLFQGNSWAAQIPAAELSRRVRALVLDRYVIQAPSEAPDHEDRDGGFWSNECGWTNLEAATRFSHIEIGGIQLPEASGSDARWLTESQAKAMVMFEELVIDGLVALRSNGSAGVVFNNLIGANEISGYDAYLAEMESMIGIAPLRGRRIEYRRLGVTTSSTVIPSTRPEEHRIRGGVA